MTRYATLLASLLVPLAIACGGDGAATPAPTATVLASTPTPRATAETLAFLRDGDILLIDADGGNERRLTNLGNVQSFSWISADELDVVTGADQSGHLLVDVEGTAQRLSFPAGGSWSRDGSRYVVPVDQRIVVYARDGSEVARLHVAPPPEEGPKARRCGEELFFGEPSKLVFGQPVFSPDGRSVVVAVNCNLYQGATGSLPASLFEASLDGAAVRPLGAGHLLGGRPPAAGDLWTELKFPSGPPRFSPDGRRIAQSIHVSGAACDQQKDQVLLADADGANSRQLTLAALAGLDEGAAPFGYVGGIIGYDWSPLGDAIVASVDVSICQQRYTVTGIEPFLAGLYVINLEGEFEAELVAGLTSSPAWSPSGRFCGVRDRRSGAVHDSGTRDRGAPERRSRSWLPARLAAVAVTSRPANQRARLAANKGGHK